MFKLTKLVELRSRNVKFINGTAETIEHITVSQTQHADSEQKTLGNTEQIKCDHCDFVAKNKFGLKIHFHKKHSSAKFNCFTCDFKCETRSDLLEHNEMYYYSHRITLNKEHEKEILDEFQQLDEDGFIPHRKLDW